MHDRIQAFIDSGAFPFLLAVGGHAKLNKTRVIETVLISLITAGVTAAATMYATQKVIEANLSNIKEQVVENSSDIKRFGHEQARRTPILKWAEKEMLK